MSEGKKDKKRRWGSILMNLIGFLLLLGTTVVTLWFAHERYLESPPKGSAEWGDFIGGFGGWLAFLWLIYSIYLQRADIKAQLTQREDDHEELELQRKAIQQQVDQMKLSGRMTAEDYFYRNYTQIKDELEHRIGKLNEWHWYVDTLQLDKIDGEGDIHMKSIISEEIDRIVPIERFLTKLKAVLLTYWKVIETKADSSLTLYSFFHQHKQHIFDIGTLVGDSHHIVNMAETLSSDKYSFMRLIFLQNIAEWVYDDSDFWTDSERVEGMDKLIKNYEDAFGLPPTWVTRNRNSLAGAQT